MSVAATLPNEQLVLQEIRGVSPEYLPNLIQIVRLYRESVMIRSLVPAQVPPRTRRSVLELQGLGKQIWRGVDPQKYVNQERDAWTG